MINDESKAILYSFVSIKIGCFSVTIALGAGIIGTFVSTAGFGFNFVDFFILDDRVLENWPKKMMHG